MKSRALLYGMAIALMTSILSTVVLAERPVNSITVVGTGIADPRLNNATQEKATACEAGMVQAQYKMYALLKRRLDANGKIATTSGEDAVKEAEVIRKEWTGRTCRVTLRVKI